MKVELHMHTNRYSGCATRSPEEMLARLVQCGYGACYLTEHDALWPAAGLETLRRQFPSLRIFPGIELTLGNHHLLVLGADDADYLFLRDPQAVLARARADGHLTVLSHPFRWPGADEPLEGPLLPDAMEYHTGNHDAMMAARSSEAALRLKVGLVNASDAHGLEAINRFWIETHRPLESADDIRAVVLQGAYSLRSAAANEDWPL